MHEKILYRYHVPLILIITVLSTCQVRTESSLPALYIVYTVFVLYVPVLSTQYSTSTLVDIAIQVLLYSVPARTVCTVRVTILATVLVQYVLSLLVE